MVYKRLKLMCFMGFAVLTPHALAADLEDRVTQLERLLNSQKVFDREQQFIRMQSDMQALRGEIEVLTHQLEQLEKQQHDIYLDIVQQLQASPTASNETKATEETVESPPEPTASSTETKVSEPTAVSNDETVYQGAFGLLQQGQYEQAITAFKAQLTQYPQGQRAEDAQYWLAETYYALKKYVTALDTFGKFLEKYPKNPKYAHAQLKIGYIYYELADYVAARAILEQIKENYPGTATAHLAEERLQLIQKEGL